MNDKEKLEAITKIIDMKFNKGFSGNRISTRAGILQQLEEIKKILDGDPSADIRTIYDGSCRFI
tara:strand:- start:165 stop:356 length:192 start_codon:yes stop_codon:yes gene_type:complete